jgi:uncharacterized protein YcfJ
MKALIGGAIGVAALGGALLLANTRSTAPGAQISNPAATAVQLQPGSYFVQAANPAVPLQPALQERVVYSDRTVAQPVTRTTTGRSESSAPARTVEVKRGRTWQKSALIIGGSAAGGAGVGALLGGGSGAKKGAVVGGLGGLVYDLATRNK